MIFNEWLEIKNNEELECIMKGINSSKYKTHILLAVEVKYDNNNVDYYFCKIESYEDDDRLEKYSLVCNTSLDLIDLSYVSRVMRIVT